MSLGASLHAAAARVAFSLWPFTFSHERLMNLLAPPVQSGLHTRRLRCYPIAIQYDAGSYIGRFLDYRGSYEEPMLRTMARLLAPGMRVLDAGANIGIHTLVAAHRVGQTGEVVAVEPQQATSRRLRDNILLNRLSNVRVHQVALGSAAGAGRIHHVSQGNDGMATMRLARSETCSSSESVEVTTLDRVIAEAWGGAGPDLIKIDVEGGELGVLEGGTETFRRCPPRYVLVECIERHLQRFGGSSRQLVEWLEGHGYQVRALSLGRWCRVGKLEGLSADLLATRR
jgi:FkbM family methyltransferase